MHAHKGFPTADLLAGAAQVIQTPDRAAVDALVCLGESEDDIVRRLRLGEDGGISAPAPGLSSREPFETYWRG